MEWLLRRNFWMVRLLGLAIVSALAANTATTLLALWVLSGSSAPTTPSLEEGDDDDDDDVVLARSTSGPDARTRRAEDTATRILGYNPFCPTCSPADATEPDPESSAEVDLDGLQLAGAQRTALPLVVAATMEAADPALSIATLVDLDQGIGGLFGVGDMLGRDVEVVGVTTGMVHIVNAGRLEYIPFEAPPPAPTGATKAPKPTSTPKRTPKSRALPGAEEAIQCSEAGSCVVDRAFVEELIANPRLLMGQGGAAPTTTKDGAPGFKLRSVRKGTLPDLLGLRNGDVITEVGGTPLTLDVLSGLYSKLRHASHIEVTVDRRGTRMRRQLEIRS